MNLRIKWKKKYHIAITLYIEETKEVFSRIEEKASLKEKLQKRQTS